jgi:RNA polymerase sigma-70 factor (ECF subfamily)
VAVLTALDQLPADQRRALVLHHLCDLPVAEVAAEVGAPVGTVKARLSRGRAALQSLLADDLTPEGDRHV